MVNPGVASTRSGGPIAAAWATLRHLGDDGYTRLAAQTWAAVTTLASGVSTVDGLRLLVEPATSVVCFTATDPAWICSYSPTSWRRAAGTCSRNWRTREFRRTSTCR